MNYDKSDYDSEATLCYVFSENKILLIEKKTGIGAGYYNGPGGKVKPDETPLEAAIRETKEEVNVTPIDVRKIGEFGIVYEDDPALFIYVFRSDEFTGGASESEEAIPIWFNTNEIPFHNMWPNDRYWFDYLLNNQNFQAEFVFDKEGNELLEYTIEEK